MIQPPTATFAALGGNGQFTLTTSAPSCAWNLTSSQGWLDPQVTSGSGNRIVSYSVTGLTLVQDREGIISVDQQSSASILVHQDGILGVSRSTPVLNSELAVRGGAGQMVWDGASVTYAVEGTTSAAVPLTPGMHRVEAQLVSADGTPGTWRFAFVGAAMKGLRGQSGKVETLGPDSITFRLSGRPGERVVFVFESEP